LYDFVAHPHLHPSSEIPKNQEAQGATWRDSHQAPKLAREQWCVSAQRPAATRQSTSSLSLKHKPPSTCSPTALGDEPEARGEPRAKNQEELPMSRSSSRSFRCLLSVSTGDLRHCTHCTHVAHPTRWRIFLWRVFFSFSFSLFSYLSGTDFKAHRHRQLQI
jgi:hypothetical protein